MEKNNANITLKKRIAAGSIATLMALSGLGGIMKNDSAKAYADTSAQKELTREEAVKLFGEEKVLQEELEARNEINKESAKQQAKQSVETAKYEISYRTGYVEERINYETNTSLDILFSKYEGYIDKEAYDQGREDFLKSIKDDFNIPKLANQDSLKQMEKSWELYISQLKNTTTKGDILSATLALNLGQLDGIKGISDPENNEAYIMYKDYINENIYFYCYDFSNNLIKQMLQNNEKVSQELGIKTNSDELKQLAVANTNCALNEFEEYKKQNGFEKEKWMMYYKGYELGYADEHYKINNQNDRVVGVPVSIVTIDDKDFISESNNLAYQGYWHGSDDQDKYTLSKKSK